MGGVGQLLEGHVINKTHQGPMRIEPHDHPGVRSGEKKGVMGGVWASSRANAAYRL